MVTSSTLAAGSPGFPLGPHVAVEQLFYDIKVFGFQAKDALDGHEVSVSCIAVSEKPAKRKFGFRELVLSAIR